MLHCSIESNGPILAACNLLNNPCAKQSMKIASTVCIASDASHSERRQRAMHDFHGLLRSAAFVLPFSQLTMWTTVHMQYLARRNHHVLHCILVATAVLLLELLQLRCHVWLRCEHCQARWASGSKEAVHRGVMLRPPAACRCAPLATQGCAFAALIALIAHQ